LLIELCRLLPPLDDAIGGSAFDPATSHQRFRVTATDYAAMALLGETVRMCRRSATNIFVEVVEWTDESYQLTSSGQCDLALGIGSASMVPNGLKVEVLCRQRFVCLISSDIRRPAKRFSLDDYLSRPHAVVDTAGRQQMMVDRPIAELGKSRSVAFQSPYFLPTALNVVGTDLVLTVPGGVAATLCHLTGLRQVLPPKEIGDFAYVMAWHPRINADAGHTWFREQIKAAACRRKNKT
jgi:DNA-binding transcriptional LysR family regulator